ncbi:hypothetical protein DVR12_22505 [Chitinophaga silvatica]|uniref:Lipoprotein n=1 Tax=Chitinophaga silvatica TaxID=2282649 RepID=A0A3E1Y406_9BACT|nr:hypothetical protein [Chitinophaga silvatica]RFS19409.1 hypothetical protein DVR12_22505 [Chitinophaga silvatica]
MKYLLLLILGGAFFSCNINKGFTTITFVSHVDRKQSKIVKYSMKIPVGYKLVIGVGGHGEKENEYNYQDLSHIYISEFPSGLANYDNIKSLGDSLARKRFEGIEDYELSKAIAQLQGKEYVREDMMLEGINSQKLYWKDMRIGFISVGYNNVPASQKDKFDSSLKSFSKK